MRIHFTFWAVMLTGLSLMAQSDLAAVRATLFDYIEGTAQGDTGRIAQAFATDAALYTVGKGNKLRRIPIEKYISFFEPGRATGRQGHIVAIDLVNNAATAVVEIDMRGRRYTDYLLLLKIEDKWQIIQKSYTYEPYDRKGRVLFVVSSASHYGDTDLPTGAHFGEIVEPYHYLTQAGYEVDIASPKGGEVPVSYIRLQDTLQQHYFYDWKFNQKLKHSLPPNAIVPDRYDGLYFAGGSAAMFDLPNHPPLMEITRQVYEDQNGIVGAVCHGPAALVNVQLSDGSYLVEGKMVSAFTNAEEENNPRKDFLPFLLQSKLESRGANFTHSVPWESHFAVDQRLVTGQNPASCKALSEAMIKLLDKKTTQ